MRIRSNIWQICLVVTLQCFVPLRYSISIKYTTVSLNLILGWGGIEGQHAIHVHRREGLPSMHYSPLALELPSLGPKPLLFKRSCGDFRLMWSEAIVWCMRENVEGKVECVCVWVCVRCRACDMAGVHQSKGRGARRLAAPDSALQEGLVWWRAHSEPSIPQDKSLGPVDRCEFSGFCAQSLETCRVRNLTFAESQIVFLNPSCCLWQFRAESERANGRRVSGCEWAWGGGLPSLVEHRLGSTQEERNDALVLHQTLNTTN